MRRKIKMLVTTRALDGVDLARMKKEAKRYGLEFEVKAARLVMPSEKRGVKTLLKFLDDDYLRSGFTGTQFVVNSKLKLQ